ncbi:hypothetical protein G9A89_014351 [Geosiphon pyriformis]|nr:hypothetical protein G9A89_014351 [Geosiphon pyriformis]
MNNAKILSTSNRFANQVQPISARFAPNLETIQNALKYDKKLRYPNVLEFEKVRSLMDTYEAEGVVISKQYGIKDAQNSKDQAVLLGVASTVIRRNSLNFSNTVFMVRSDEPRGRVLATFISDKETLPVIDLMFEQFIEYSRKSNIQSNPKWLAMDKWDSYLVAAKKHFPKTQVVLCDWHEEFDQRKLTLLDSQKFQAAIGIRNLAIAKAITTYFRLHWFSQWIDTWPDYKRIDCPMKTNMLVESYFKKDMILHYRGRYTKSLHSNLEKITTSMRVDAGEMERFWQGEGKNPTKSKLEREKEKMNQQGELLYKKIWYKCTWSVIRFTSMNVTFQHFNSENLESEIPEAINKDCFKQWIKPLYVTCRNGKSAAESSTTSSLESYLRQRDANGRAENELRLPQKRGPKNKRKTRLIPQESIQLQDTVLDRPYYKAQIAEIIGDGKIIVDITFEDGNTEQHTLQLADIIGYADEPSKKNRSAFDNQNIYKQAVSFAEIEPTSQTNRLRVFELMKQKRWFEAKILWIAN